MAPVPRLLAEAWERFIDDPDGYGAWQAQRLEQLW
jgi:hypothetical protein